MIDISVAHKNETNVVDGNRTILSHNVSHNVCPADKLQENNKSDK
jgi:hypothetical protein